MKNNHLDLIEKSLQFLKQLKINEPLICDHICYRVTSKEDYESLKTEILKSADFVHEAMVRGRPISIFKYHKPLEHMGLTINSLELPCPKPDNKYAEGFEHVEFVIKNLDKLIIDNPDIEFDTTGMGRNLNPELAISIDEFYQIKFHPLDILEVVQIERSLNLITIE